MMAVVRALATGIMVVAAVSGCGSTGSSPDVPATPAGPVVVVANLAFTPDSITVNAGETVTWKFDDRGIPHDVVGVGSAKSVLHSAPMENGIFSFTFADPGTYQYQCTFHPTMRGTVTVR